MKIKWWGHSCFLLTSKEGTTVLTDPYDAGFPYEEVDDNVDIVTVSHDHHDHNAVDRISGSPRVIKDIKGLQQGNINIKGIKSYHDGSRGEKKGENIIFIFEFPEFKIGHLGDLGHDLEEEQLEALKDLDILLIPVGGYFTIDAEQAYNIVKKIKPAITIPMHYNTKILNLPISNINAFTSLIAPEKIVITGKSEIEINLISDTQLIYIMDYVGKENTT